MDPFFGLHEDAETENGRKKPIQRAQYVLITDQLQHAQIHVPTYVIIAWSHGGSTGHTVLRHDGDQ